MESRHARILSGCGHSGLPVGEHFPRSMPLGHPLRNRGGPLPFRYLYGQHLGLDSGYRFCLDELLDHGTNHNVLEHALAGPGRCGAAARYPRL